MRLDDGRAARVRRGKPGNDAVGLLGQAAFAGGNEGAGEPGPMIRAAGPAGVGGDEPRAGQTLRTTDPDLLAELLTEARSTTLAALDDLRTVMQGIQPPVLADRGLEGAVRALALDIAVPVTVTGGLAGRAPAPVESAAYFTAAECLANVIKHSSATAAWVDLRHEAGVLSVVVGDNGAGGASVDGGTGLRRVVRRLESLDGTVTVSSPAGGPTTVTMEVPCELSSPKT